MRTISIPTLLDELFSESLTYSNVNNDYIVETDESFEIEIDMPGVNKDNIDISIEDDYLTISATRKTGDTTGKVIKSAQNKTYMKSYKLGTGVNQSDIKAKYENGVLKVTVGKNEKPKAKKVTIE